MFACKSKISYIEFFLATGSERKKKIPFHLRSIFIFHEQFFAIEIRDFKTNKINKAKLEKGRERVQFLIKNSVKNYATDGWQNDRISIKNGTSGFHAGNGGSLGGERRQPLSRKKIGGYDLKQRDINLKLDLEWFSFMGLPNVNGCRKVAAAVKV